MHPIVRQYLTRENIPPIYSTLIGFTNALGVADTKLVPNLASAMPKISFHGRWYTFQPRGTMIDVLRSEYIRTARAKGLTWRQVVIKHALRNAMGPVITQIGLDLGYFLGGVIIVVESVFAWPGVGQVAFTAITQDDINLVMGTVLVSAVFVVLTNILVDVAQAWLDPRIRLE